LHTDSISAITSTRDGRLIATGQQGHDAIVAVWDSRSLQTIRTLPDRQLCSITALAFSNNTVLLAVASLDEDHTISVYNWKERLLIARAQGGGSRIFDFSFSERDTALLSCGVKSIKLWTVANRCMTSSVPVLNALGDLQSFLCCTYFAGLPVIGAVDGSLYILSAIGDILRRNVKAHDGEICSIHTSLDNKQLVSGGKDGMIRIWNTNYDCLKEIQLESILSYRSPRIRSVCFNGDGTLLLVGTRGSEVLEINIRSGTMLNSKPLLQGHGYRELWGLSCHPKKEEFITTGDDGTLRFWDLKNFVMTKKINIDASSRAVTYNSDGSLIAIGFGGGGRSRSKSTSKDGAFIVMNSVDNKIIHEGKDSNEPIRVIKFSNDGKFLAVGSEDSKIYIYNVKDKYTRRSVVSSHRAPVLHIDFTADSQFFTSVDSTNRIFNTESSSGVNVPSPAALRDEKWATWTCPVGWPVQGFWRSQPSDSFPCCAQRSWSGMLLACGNTCGRVFLSHNPCIREAGFSDQFGHAGAISRIGWSAGDSYVVTIGSIDNVIMQWKCVYDAAKESGDEGGRSCEDSDVEKLGGQEFKIATKSKSASSEVNPQWITNIAPPSDLQDDDSRSPNVRSILEVVHGAQISDCRQTFAYNQDGNVVYAAAACCIVYDRDKHEQHVFCGETGGVICMDVDPSGKVGASGSRGSDPFVYFWDSRTAKLLDSHTGIHKNGISSVKFSSDSAYLVTLGQDSMNSIVVLRSDSKRWNDAYVFASCGVSFLKMFWVLYADGNEYPIVVGGNRCMFFFRVSGKSMERSRGVFGRRRKLQPLLCGVVAAETSGGSGSKAILTGTVTGQIYQWLGRKVNSVISAHDAPVTALSRCRHGYASGSKDGLIKLWTKDLKLIYTFNSQAFEPVPYIPCCNSISVNGVNSRLLLGNAS
jgi:WD40 repeat protein